MKKLICALLALTVMISCIPASAAEFKEKVSSRCVVLIDADTGAILYEKNGDAKALPASTTKIMTCILLLEKGNLDEIVTVPEVTNRGSCMKIKKGEKMSLRSLMYGMMLISGNDCAEAIAHHIGGSKEEFLVMMNNKAKELGMTGTNFAEPSGLNNENHYTTARDFAKLTRYAMMLSEKKNDFRAVVKRTTYKVRDSSLKKTYELETTNKLLYTKTNADGVKAKSFEYSSAIGVKTGSTPYANECLVAAAKKGNVTLIAVIFDEKDGDTRFTLSKKLFDWGFASYKSVPVADLSLNPSIGVVVSNAKPGELTANTLMLSVDLEGKKVSGDDSFLEELKNNSSQIEARLVSGSEIDAPIEEGSKVATVEYYYKDRLILSASGTASRAVEVDGDKASLGDMTTAEPTPEPTIEPEASPEPSGTPPPLVSQVAAKQKKGGNGLMVALIIIISVLLVLTGLVMLRLRVLKIRRQKRKLAAMRRSRQE